MAIAAEDILESFDSPGEMPYVIEHTHEEFTSVCPMTGHPDFGTVIVRYSPAAACVELKSLKLYLHAFRNEGMFFEAVANRICEDLNTALSPRWLQVIARFRGRGGIRSEVRVARGDVPPEWRAS
ncbi:MAG: preQ(1) synthase [Phycisphaerales bacterium]|nr:preQ(1) synthase [Phycisphaerales bacterium]